MELFNVYDRFDLAISAGNGVELYDQSKKTYLDLYGGHGVISIGHSHPYFIQKMEEQLHQLIFYSNSIEIPIQQQLAKKLGEVCDYPDYQLFLCNSGAEANENALKLASHFTQKKTILSFKGSFHGRTLGAVQITDKIKYRSPINEGNFEVIFVELNNENQVLEVFSNHEISAVIVEGIQGVGGLDFPSDVFLKLLREICTKENSCLILDEIQSGYGRTGDFFAHQSSGIKADLITIAKGMGNGFPVAGVLINPEIKPLKGLLGTTFGGNQFACTAALAVLEILEKEELQMNVQKMNQFIVPLLEKIPGVVKIKGKGLMLGIEFEYPISNLRKQLLVEKHLFTGDSANPNLLRILPPLSINEKQLVQLPNALNELLS
jgi:acetylornithine/N-succinyldiaminopimelate aminotransferase